MTTSVACDPGEVRVVVLYHDQIPDPHYDLMFETAPGSPLATWRSAAWPVPGIAHVERLSDHRNAYLTYEGAVSRNRGRVGRVFAATGTCIANDAERFTFTTSSLRFHFSQHGHRWQLQCETMER